MPTPTQRNTNKTKTSPDILPEELSTDDLKAAEATTAPDEDETNVSDGPDSEEGTVANASEGAPKKTRGAGPHIPWSASQQMALVKTIAGIAKGRIRGSLTPASVVAHLKTLPEFQSPEEGFVTADQLDGGRVINRVRTLKRQAEEEGLPLDIPAFETSRSEKVDFAALSAVLAE